MDPAPRLEIWTWELNKKSASGVGDRIWIQDLASRSRTEALDLKGQNPGLESLDRELKLRILRSKTQSQGSRSRTEAQNLKVQSSDSESQGRELRLRVLRSRLESESRVREFRLRVSRSRTEALSLKVPNPGPEPHCGDLRIRSSDTESE